MCEHSSEIKQLLRTAGGSSLSYQEVNVTRLRNLGAAVFAIQYTLHAKNVKKYIYKTIYTFYKKKSLSKNEYKATSLTILIRYTVITKTVFIIFPD